MSDELGISDEKDEYCCSTGKGGVSETGSCTKSGSMMMFCSCCWPAVGTVSGLAEEARSCAFSTQVLGSESLEGCGEEGLALRRLHRNTKSHNRSLSACNGSALIRCDPCSDLTVGAGGFLRPTYFTSLVDRWTRKPILEGHSFRDCS